VNKRKYKVCTKCKKRKLATNNNFYRLKNGKYGLSAECKVCNKKHKKIYYRNNFNKISLRAKIWGKQHRKERTRYMRTLRHNTKLKIINYYGGKCACCGESNLIFLNIDHINNDGAEHRRKIGRRKNDIYLWIKSNNFPPGFQVLCFNCNCGRQLNGGICPHKNE
jgi:hypothetical protein